MKVCIGVHMHKGNNTRIRSREELKSYEQSDDAGVVNGSSCRESMNKRDTDYDRYVEESRPTLGDKRYGR